MNTRQLRGCVCVVKTHQHHHQETQPPPPPSPTGYQTSAPTSPDGSPPPPLSRPKKSRRSVKSSSIENMVEAGRTTTEISQGRVLWRPRQEEQQSERAIPPWADPHAQPPPPPPPSTTFVATLSPPPQRRGMMKPASPLTSATEVSPNPTHFNRPTPGASPVMVRRSLFRNNATPSARARSVDSSINRAPPWADHQLRPTHRTESPSRCKGRTDALSPPPASPPATSASPSATTSSHTSDIHSTSKTSSGSTQKAVIDSASTSTTRTASSNTVMSSTEMRRVEMKESSAAATAAYHSSDMMTKTPVVPIDSSPGTSTVGVVSGKCVPPGNTSGQSASDGHPRSHQAQVTSRQQTVTAGMQSAAGTMVSTRTVTEGQAAPPTLSQEQSSPTPWRKNRTAVAKDAPALTQPRQASPQSSHDVSVASGAVHHTINVVQEGRAEEQAVQSAPWRRQVTSPDKKTPPPASVPTAPTPSHPPVETPSSTPPPAQPPSESHAKGKSGLKATDVQPWRKQRPKGRQTPPPATTPITVATTTCPPQAAAPFSHTPTTTQATNISQVGAISTHQAKSLTSSVSAISQESSVTETTVSVQKQTKASFETSVKVSSSVPSASTSTTSVATKTKQASTESKTSSVSSVSDQTKTPAAASSVTPLATKTTREANKQVEEAVREKHLLASKSERGTEGVAVCDAKRATPTSSVPTSAAPPASCAPTQQLRPTEAATSSGKSDLTVPQPAPPPPTTASQLPPTSSASVSSLVSIQTLDKTSLGTSVQATTTTPIMPIPTPPPAPDAKQLKSVGRSAPQQAATSPGQQGTSAGEGSVEKGVAFPQPTPAGQDTVAAPVHVGIDLDLPPPPATLLQGDMSAPTLASREACETDDPSQEYIRESVTKRIKAFEKQASLEDEPPTSLERHLPPARPVAPWVKKTSTGPVQQEVYWGATSPEEQEAPLPPPPPPAAPSRPKTDRTMSPSRPQPVRESPKVVCVSSLLTHPDPSHLTPRLSHPVPSYYSPPLPPRPILSPLSPRSYSPHFWLPHPKI
ncbi:hypothetical protein Pmani_024601 [Petrolisthes manimaculis]|uniref:Uncharacterized protein n=1 Tax=Petrolisthes manimaculis TaxID=1843537 RepID=A0AAE1P7U3_9EUCA|nr:hypothetical protein Pmani_024601 [Petrolisthes manimaculis]